MKKALLLLLVLPALASGCHADHTFMVYTLKDIVGLFILAAVILVVGGMFLYTYVSDWLRSRKKRKKQNAGNKP